MMYGFKAYTIVYNLKNCLLQIIFKQFYSENFPIPSKLWSQFPLHSCPIATLTRFIYLSKFQSN